MLKLTKRECVLLIFLINLLLYTLALKYVLQPLIYKTLEDKVETQMLSQDIDKMGLEIKNFEENYQNIETIKKDNENINKKILPNINTEGIHSLIIKLAKKNNLNIPYIYIQPEFISFDDGIEFVVDENFSENKVTLYFSAKHVNIYNFLKDIESLDRNIIVNEIFIEDMIDYINGQLNLTLYTNNKNNDTDEFKFY